MSGVAVEVLVARHWDVIGIGSGARGATLTRAMAPTEAEILLLERGGWLPREAESRRPRGVWEDGRYHNPGGWIDGTNSE